MMPAFLFSVCLRLLTRGLPPPCGAVSGASARLPLLVWTEASGKASFSAATLAAFLCLAASLEAAIFASTSGLRT